MAPSNNASNDIPSDIREFIRQALAEDIGHGDLTTNLLIPREQKCSAHIVTRETCNVAGLHFAFEAFRLLEEDVQCEALVEEGQRVRKDTVLATIKGHTRTVLTAERTALNILQRTTGIATLTRKFVDEVEGLSVRVLDTRKTTPMLRAIEKYAVRKGGGRNHRFGLYDGILIKDNHILAAGGITNAVKRARGAHPFMKIEVETGNVDEVMEAIAAGASIVMLDNMSLEEMREAVKKVDRRAEIEASGGVNLDTARAIAETGVHYISVGALTHSAPAADLSLEILETD